MRRQIVVFAVGLVLAALFSVPGAAATPVSEAQHARTVVDLAGRQRMLTQRMTAAACVILVGVADAARVEVAKSARDMFSVTLAGLRDGDAALGLLEQMDPTVLAALDQIEHSWRSFGAAIAQVSHGEQHSVPVNQILRLNTLSLEQSDAVVQALVVKHGAGPADPALVRTIDIAGRQRMLSQKIMKEACFWLVGLDRANGETRLRASIALFSQSLRDLQNGNPDADIIAPPDADVVAQLALVDTYWDTYVAAIEALIQTPDPAQRRAGLLPLAALSDQLLLETNRAVGLYVDP